MTTAILKRTVTAEMADVTTSDATIDSSSPPGESIKLSASRLKTYVTCPRQFRYRYVEELPTVLTGALAFGKTIHQVIHDLHQWSIYSSEPLHEQVALSNFARLWEQVVSEQQPEFKHEEEITEYASLAELMLVGYVESQKGKASPFLLEFPFAIKLHDEQSGQGILLRGVIDRIDQEEDGLVIVDFKTGKRKPSARDLAFDLQLTLYAYAAREIFGQEVLAVQLHHLRDQTVFHTRRGPADERTLMAVTIPHVVAGIQEKRFPPHLGYWCRFCEYRERCQAEGPDNIS